METLFSFTIMHKWRLFKSYYVVWKQQEYKKDFIIPYRLNRTM